MAVEHPAATVLRRVQQALQQRLDPSIYRTADIYVGKYSNALPPGIRCPAVGIRRKTSRREQGTCNTERWTVDVELQCWDADGGSPDAAVLGSTAQPGILGVEWAVDNALLGDPLGCMEGGIPASDSDVPSDGGAASGLEVQFSVVVWRYIIEIQRGN